MVAEGKQTLTPPDAPRSHGRGERLLVQPLDMQWGCGCRRQTRRAAAPRMVEGVTFNATFAERETGPTFWAVLPDTVQEGWRISLMVRPNSTLNSLHR